MNYALVDSDGIIRNVIVLDDELSPVADPDLEAKIGGKHTEGGFIGRPRFAILDAEGIIVDVVTGEHDAPPPEPPEDHTRVADPQSVAELGGSHVHGKFTPPPPADDA